MNQLLLVIGLIMLAAGAPAVGYALLDMPVDRRFVARIWRLVAGVLGVISGMGLIAASIPL